MDQSLSFDWGIKYKFICDIRLPRTLNITACAEDACGKHAVGICYRCTGGTIQKENGIKEIAIMERKSDCENTHGVNVGPGMARVLRQEGSKRVTSSCIPVKSKSWIYDCLHHIATILSKDVLERRC